MTLPLTPQARLADNESYMVCALKGSGVFFGLGLYRAARPKTVLEVLLDERALRLAGPPRIAVRMRGRLLERDDHRDSPQAADALAGLRH